MLGKGGRRDGEDRENHQLGPVVDPFAAVLAMKKKGEQEPYCCKWLKEG